MQAPPAKVSHNELIKEANPTLAGTIKQTLLDPSLDRFSEDDGQFLKFHGIYQQDDRVSVVLASLFLISVMSMTLYQSYDQRQFLAQRSPLYGVWEVEEFNVGQASPRWWRVIFDSPRRMAVQTGSDPHQRFMSELDQEKHTLTIRKREDPSWNTVLTYEQVSPEVVTLTGTLNGSEMTARLRRSGERKFLLTDRGFHWINEFPFNR